MKLQAAHRLLADSSMQQLRDVAKTLDEQQLTYLFYGLPLDIRRWYAGTFNGPISVRLPKLTLAATAADRYQSLILGLGHIRHLFPPQKVGTIQRITVVDPKLLQDKIIKYDPQEFKQLTSWTYKNTLPSTIAEPDEKHGSMIVLKTKINGTKHVLATAKSCSSFVQTVAKDAHWYIDRLGELGTSKDVAKIRKEFPQYIAQISRVIKDYDQDEGEVMVFLNKGETLACTWELA
jgi:hypothetical protein